MKKLFIVTTKTNNSSITKQENSNVSNHLKGVKGVKIGEVLQKIKTKVKVNYEDIPELQGLINHMLGKLKLGKGEDYTYQVEHHVNDYKIFTEHKNTNGVNGVKASFIYYYDVRFKDKGETSLNFYPTIPGIFWGTRPNKSRPVSVPVESGTMVAFTSEYHKPIVKGKIISRKLVGIFAIPKKKNSKKS